VTERNAESRCKGRSYEITCHNPHNKFMFKMGVVQFLLLSQHS